VSIQKQASFKNYFLSGLPCRLVNVQVSVSSNPHNGDFFSIQMASIIPLSRLAIPLVEQLQGTIEPDRMTGYTFTIVMMGKL
jgi:hypothetical protein